MYRHYSRGDSQMLTMDQRKRNRLKDLIILLLAVALAVVCVLGVPAMQSKSGNHQLYVQRIRSECEEAVRLTNTLSRNAGADSASLLARIRSNVYSMQVINVLSINQDGPAGTLIEPTTVSSILNIIDQYLSVLITGMATGEQQTALLGVLETVLADLVLLN